MIFIPKRTPRDYDGTRPTSRRFTEVLPAVLEKIGDSFKDRPDLILASWPEIIGKELASMTRADSFVNGVLVVKVKNAPLHSVLHREKASLLARLRQKFPRVKINHLIFRIG